MRYFRVTAFGLLVWAGGCATPPAPSPAPEAPAAPSFVQVDEEHLIRIRDIKSAEFSDQRETGSDAAYTIMINDGGTFVQIGFTDQAKANDAWARVSRALGGTLLKQNKTPTSRPGQGKLEPATQPERHITDVPADDTYTHLTTQLGWLMKCVDAKLLSDSEYQQGRAWAIAELQNNPQGFSGVFAPGSRAGNAPDFEHLYRQLVSLAKGKEAGLLNDDEAAKVRAAILKQAGLVE